MFKTNLLTKLKTSDFFEKIDLYFADFIASLNSESQNEIFLTAAFLSKKAREGNAFIYLQDILSELAKNELFTKIDLLPFHEWGKILQKAIGFSESNYTPIIFTKDQKFYFYRYWEYEKEIQEKIKKLANSVNPIEPKLSEFKDSDLWQKIALHLALKKDFLVITGGPGTGKTTIILKIIDLLSNANLRIAVAAPTGKAAARITEALAQSSANNPLRDYRTAKKAITIHRLLGAKNYSNQFTYNKDNPMPYDLLIIDEASMIDLPLFYQLFSALGENARLILLGDKNQLGPVNIGSVFSDICAKDNIDNFSYEVLSAFKIEKSKLETDLTDLPLFAFQRDIALSDTVVELKENYRLKGNLAILEMSKAINKGNTEAVINLANQNNDITWQALPDKSRLKEELKRFILPFYKDYFKSKNLKDFFQKANQFKLLLAQKTGVFSTDTFNNLLEEIFLAEGLIANTDLYSGKQIIVNKNNYNLNLYNGDLGIVFADDLNKFQVYFEIDGQIVSYNLNYLNAYDLGFAITVHKSQGSEFEEVCLILPDEVHPLLTRKLFYTAVTRAKKRLTIWGDRQIINYCFRN